MEAYGLMSHDEGTQFVLAALSYSMDGQYTLHIFRSRDSKWTKGLLQVDYGLTKKAKLIDPTHVMALQDGLLGWVDLWDGILICDVSAFALPSGNGMPPAESRFIPMPRLLPSNQELYLEHDFLRPIRDVAFHRGRFKCVELEQLAGVVPNQEEDDVYEVFGWRLVSWYRELPSDHWRRGTMVHSDDLGPISLPQLRGGGAYAVNLSFKDLQICYPILHGGDDVVYLISILDRCNQTAWIVAVDTKIKSLSMPMPFSADTSFLLDPTHIPCVLTKYLDAKSDS
jgi:hypothetical protein